MKIKFLLRNTLFPIALLWGMQGISVSAAEPVKSPPVKSPKAKSKTVPPKAKIVEEPKTKAQSKAPSNPKSKPQTSVATAKSKAVVKSLTETKTGSKTVKSVTQEATNGRDPRTLHKMVARHVSNPDKSAKSVKPIAKPPMVFPRVPDVISQGSAAFSLVMDAGSQPWPSVIGNVPVPPPQSAPESVAVASASRLVVDPPQSNPPAATSVGATPVASPSLESSHSKEKATNQDAAAVLASVTKAKSEELKEVLAIPVPPRANVVTELPLTSISVAESVTEPVLEPATPSISVEKEESAAVVESPILASTSRPLVVGKAEPAQILAERVQLEMPEISAPLVAAVIPTAPPAVSAAPVPAVKEPSRASGMKLENIKPAMRQMTTQIEQVSAGFLPTPPEAPTPAPSKSITGGLGPLSIDADRMESDQSTGKFVFSGNVDLVSEKFRLRANSVTATRKPEGDGMKEVFASGEVKLDLKADGGTLQCYGKTAVYDPNSQVIRLTGWARIDEGARSLVANSPTTEFVIDTKTGKLTSNGATKTVLR